MPRHFSASGTRGAPVAVLLDLVLQADTVDRVQGTGCADLSCTNFIVTGDGDVNSAVEAVKNGAFDCRVSRLDARSIVARVRRAVATFAMHDGRGSAENCFVDGFSR